MTRTIFAARAVLFDWDGTLLNSFAADERAYQTMFQSLGVKFTSEDLARNYHPDWYLVYRAAKIDRDRWGKADRIWREAYALETPRLMPAARAVLRNLAKRFTLGLVTSGSRDRVCLQLENFEVARRFAVRVCSEDASPRKPHPAPLKMALRLVGLSPRECVYVGDSRQDIEMARRAGVRSIGIPGPFPTERGLRAARPDLLLNSLKDLPRHLTHMPQTKEMKEIISSKRASGAKKRRELRQRRKKR